jgi:hypothetical protein
MVQYHALSLLYKIKQHDRLAVSKIVQQLSKGEYCCSPHVTSLHLITLQSISAPYQAVTAALHEIVQSS